MAARIHGATPTPTLLPGSTTRERDDEVLEGTAVWECDKANFLSLPEIGVEHPYDTRLKCIAKDIEFGAMKARATCNYMGLVSSPTRAIITWPGATGQDPIETHPAFVRATADFPYPLAGTIGAAYNGAYFRRPEAADETTVATGEPAIELPAEFMGFFDSSENGRGLYAVTGYYVANPIVYLSYWTDEAPSLEQQMTIVDEVPGLIAPPDVVDWLQMTPQYREISGGLFYQVTDTYMGSGPNGWNDLIYKRQ